MLELTVGYRDSANAFTKAYKKRIIAGKLI